MVRPSVGAAASSSRWAAGRVASFRSSSPESLHRGPGFVTAGPADSRDCAESVASPACAPLPNPDPLPRPPQPAGDAGGGGPIEALGRRAKAASRAARARRPPQSRTPPCSRAPTRSCGEAATILAANAEDVARAESDGVSATVIDRLRLSSQRIDAMAAGLRQVAALADPVGEVVDGWVRPNGLRIERVRVPLGVVAIIYENRPNVTSDAAGLCLKSGNAGFPAGLVGRHQLEHRHRPGAAGGVRRGGAPGGLPDPGRGHQPCGRGDLHAAARLGGRADPAWRTVAHRLDPRARHGALRDRRRRQLPRLRRRIGRPGHGGAHRRERQDPASFGVQRSRVSAGPRRRSPTPSCPDSPPSSTGSSSSPTSGAGRCCRAPERRPRRTGPRSSST